jgi:PTS system fructose-specific IIC component/PTS system nitrogen regulatory IIA component
MLLSEIFDARHIKLELESETKDEAFEELIETLLALHPELNRQEVREAILMRENKMNTAIIPGIAVPHGCCPALNGIVGVIGISRAGIAYDTEDRQPVHCIFMVLMGASCREKHLRVLSHLLNLLNPQVFSEIMAAQSVQEIHNILRRF